MRSFRARSVLHAVLAAAAVACRGGATIDETDDDTDPATNAAPTAAGDAYQTDADAPLVVDAEGGVLANDTDPERVTLTAALTSPPINGVLLFSADGSFEYHPNASFLGNDTFAYVATDSELESAAAIVQIAVTEPNDAPVPTADSYTIAQDTTLAINAANGVLANDTDPESDPLSVTVLTDVANGTFVLSGDGAFVYTPDSGFEGLDSFEYAVSDGFNAAATGTCSIAVGNVPFPPVATDDAFPAVSGQLLLVPSPGVLGNDSDGNDDALTARLDAPPAHGTLSLRSDGGFEYTSDATYRGTDSFTYHAHDGGLDSNVATVTLTVAGNTAPVATGDAYTLQGWVMPLVVSTPGVLGNDTDADGDPLQAVLVTTVSNGTLALNPNGSFTYRARAMFTGSDSFTYQAWDGTDLSAITTASITVE